MGHRLRRQAGDPRDRAPSRRSSSSGVGVSNPDKVGRTSATICGVDPIGHRRDRRPRRARSRSSPTRSCTTGRPPRIRTDNIRDIGAFLRAGIDVCSTAMTPWVWPAMTQNPPQLDRADHRGVRGGRRVVLHDRHRSRLRQRPLPDDAHGPVLARCGWCARSRSSTTSTTRATTRTRWASAARPSSRPLLEHPDILTMAWGATVPMMAHAVGIELDEITTTWDKWVTDTPITTAKGVDQPGRGRGDQLHDQRHLQGRDPHPARARQPRRHRRRARLAARHPGRRLPRRDRGHAVDHPGDGVPLHRRQRPRRRDRRLPGDRAAGAQRRARGERAAAGLGHRARPARSSRASAPSADAPWPGCHPCGDAWPQGRCGGVGPAGR